MMLEGAILGALYFFLARFIGSKIKFKVHVAILILVTAIVCFLTVLLLSYYQYALNYKLSGSTQGSLVGGPSGFAAVVFFLGFKQGYKPRENFKKEDPIEPILGIFDEAKIGVNDTYFDDFADELKKQVVEEKLEILRFIIESGKTPKAWVYRLLAIELAKVLQSGELHIYRGVLNPNGTGLLKAIDFIINKLVEMHDMTVEQASKDKATVRNEIRRMG